MCILTTVMITTMSVIILVGCSNATDKTLSPLNDTKWVNVEVKNPSRYTK